MITVSIMQLASVRRIIAYAEAQIEQETQQPVRLAVIEKLEGEGIITAEQVRDFVCMLLGISIADIISGSRKAHLADARRIISIIAKDYTPAVYREIGETMGGRDHSTAINNYQTGYALLDANDALFAPKYTMVYNAFSQHLSQIKQKSDEQKHTTETLANTTIEMRTNVCNQISESPTAQEDFTKKQFTEK